MVIFNQTIKSGRQFALEPDEYTFRFYKEGYKPLTFTDYIQSSQTKKVTLVKEESISQSTVREYPSGKQLTQEVKQIDLRFLIIPVIILLGYMLIVQKGGIEWIRKK